MPAPTLTPANAPVSKTAARWRLAVDGDYVPTTPGSAATDSADASWLQVFGISDFSPGTVDYTEQDDTDYDSVDESGIVWASSTTTGAAWTITVNTSPSSQSLPPEGWYFAWVDGPTTYIDDGLAFIANI